ncbi:hypothetical protein [Phenylobacterium sp.]|uniref:hypothetical protein n=1 Tax=Phenylobacterium sp. TaxID=1871053 RepID=UPI002DF5E96E|nr:hypothetical protein [Phenylobacterium sp.]
MRRYLLAAALLGLAMASAAHAQVVHPGQQEGLGLTGPGIPQVLKDARDNPYALSANPSCDELGQQIGALDAVLGPDVDTPQARSNGGPDLMAGVRAILPYGGVVRLVTGAGHREKALVNAALAGWERRGFLKGTARVMGCPVFGQPGGPTLYNPQGPGTPPR